MSKIIALLILPGLVLLSGCAASRNISDLQSRVDSLESQASRLDSSVSALQQGTQRMEANLTEQGQLLQKVQDAQKRNSELIKKAESKGHAKMPDAKDIQAALTYAGYYKGEIDGVIGEKTKESIKSFQSANELNPDGVVGSRTWSLLSKHLEESKQE